MFPKARAGSGHSSSTEGLTKKLVPKLEQWNNHEVQEMGIVVEQLNSRNGPLLKMAPW